MSLKQITKKRKQKNDEFFALRSPTDMYFFLQSKYCKDAGIAKALYSLFDSKKDWESCVLILAAGSKVSPDFLKHMGIRNPLDHVVLNKILVKKIVSFYYFDALTPIEDITSSTLSDSDICDIVLSGIAKSYLSFLDNTKKVSIQTIRDWLFENKSDLTGFDLTGLDLTGIDLSDGKLNGADLTDCILNEALLTNADLSCTAIKDTEFVNAKLIKANLCGAHLINANLHKSDLSTANLAFSKIEMTNAVDCDFSGANFSYSTIMHGNFSRSDFEGAIFDTSEIKAVLFKGANLNGTALSHYDTNRTHINHNIA